jgi:hypothetical protein
LATPETLTTTGLEARWFAPLSARRMLVLAGLGMILLGMIFGDIFAVFILHQNAAQVGKSLSSAANAALAGNPAGVRASLGDVGQFLENRGTKVDTHVHLIGFGYLALMLGIVQPWISMSEAAKRKLAWLLVLGGVLLPVCVFLIHYVGLAYSPLRAIGWASIFADAGGLVVMLATAGYLFGLIRHFADAKTVSVPDGLLNHRSQAARVLLAGGLCLILIGFLHGALYAGAHLYGHETADFEILSRMSYAGAAQDSGRVNQSLENYGQLQGEKAVNLAAHSHFAEFGVLAMLLGFFQPYVGLSRKWKVRWAGVLLLGSALLPVCVLLELKFGLLAGGLADLGGLLVIGAGFAMWVGVVKYSGSLDAMGGGSK